MNNDAEECPEPGSRITWNHGLAIVLGNSLARNFRSLRVHCPALFEPFGKPFVS
jgi:hypothetical protein